MPGQSVKVDKFCSACGNGLIISAVVCPQCGSPVTGGSVSGSREKSVAVVLAVFLSAWSFLYTYKYDAKKFWISTIASFVLLIVAVVSYVIYEISFDYDVYTLANAIFILFLILWLIASLTINIIAIVVAATRQDSFYNNY
jgi:uncharacterized membrane protein YvbJ